MSLYGVCLRVVEEWACEHDYASDDLVSFQSNLDDATADLAGLGWDDLYDLAKRLTSNIKAGTAADIQGDDA